MTSERTGSQTDANLLVALAGEADANRALSRVRDRGVHGRGPDIALFFEAAGAETIHALEHLRTMRTIGITRENL
jgi:rubrerythrin